MKYLDLIERTAHERALAIAVRTSTGARLTYGELWAHSESLAIRIAKSADAGSPVLVYGNKDPLMVVCFLACMKAGCPYVPIDSHSVPAARVASIAGQVAAACGAALVLAVDEFPQAEKMPPCTVLTRTDLSAIAQRAHRSDRARWIEGEDIAYILFTSGSTGAPKGVEVTAACFDAFCLWDLQLSRPGSEGPGCGEVWIDQAPFSFDLSMFELAGALAAGGTLFCLAFETQQGMAALLEALASSDAGVWVSTPSFVELCMANPEFGQRLLPKLRLFLFCGETLPNATAARLAERFPSARVINTYGPTEATVAVTSIEVTSEMAASPRPLPVGAPRPGTRIRILDEEGLERAVGEHGEVVIEGVGVARGYYGRPDLTARAFGEAVLDGVRVRTYRTGDEGYLDDAGHLHFRGRLDLQVKLNGFRIELGEIEEHLRRLPEVAAAAVVACRRDGRVAHLVAHVVPARPLAQTPFRAGLALKDRLKKTVPHYMVPKKVVFCETLPMTGNGKVDRRALESLRG